MGLSISPDIFQEHMSKLFADLPYMKVFLDDLLYSAMEHLKTI
jgi:hypothetical protein